MVKKMIIQKSNSQNIFKILFFSFMFLIIAGSVLGETFKDSFSNGRTQLRWMFYPHFFNDNLIVEKDPSAPEGDFWVGVLRNSNVGGFAALSYTVTKEVSNFYLEALIYCPLVQKEKGPLVGVAFLIDPINGRFYRLVCDFNLKNPSLNIAYVGKDTNHYPVYLRFWELNEISRKLFDKSDWHKVGIMVKNGKAKVYWNDKELKGEIDVSKIKRGFVGVYANFVGGLGLAETKIDYLRLRILE